MKKILAIIMSLVVLATFTFFAVGSGDKDSEESTTELTTENKTEADVTTTEPETELPTLTDEQIKSFEKLMNESLFSNTNYNEKSTGIDYIVNTYICASFWSTPDRTMFDHYFPDDYKEKYSETGGPYSNITYEFDADKVLFILNDVFGYNATKELRSERFYFSGDKFYYTIRPMFTDFSTVEFSVDSYEPVADGYFKLNLNYVVYEYGTGDVTKGEEGYYIVKPLKHEKYGNYWKFKEIGKDDKVYIVFED